MRPLTVDQLDTHLTAAMAADDWQTVADLEIRLDAATPPRPVAQLAAAALWYASIGLPVFPLQPQAKIPYRGSRGFQDATTDPARITGWWQRRPDSNIGIATGHVVDVIDIDGPLGVESWARSRNLPPILGTVSTPRAGGSHLYIAPTGEGNGAKIFPGVDYRGLGGYVVAPPSYVVEASKGYEGPYRWRRPLQLVPVEVAA